MTVARCPNDYEILSWVWPKVKRFLLSPLAKAGDKYALDDVLFYLLSKPDDYHLWLIEDEGIIIAACVTCYVKYPRKLFTNVWLVGGSGFSKWGEALIGNVIRMSKEAGCVGLELCGRKGWLKVLGKYITKSEFAMECAL